MSADDWFPIFTLFFMSEIFLLFIVLLLASYIPFSSDLVNITVHPLCSNRFCTFSVIFRFIFASVVPFLLCAPSSGYPCPASKITTFPDTGVDVAICAFSSSASCLYENVNIPSNIIINIKLIL